MRRFHSGSCVLALVLSTFIASSAWAAFKPGTWTQVGGTVAPLCAGGTPFLLTDGRVLIQDNCNGGNGFGTVWWTLTPDNTGSYTSSSVTWTQVATIPASFSYGPLYYSSYVLANGNVVINGGEYNLGPNVETTLGAYFNPQTGNCSGCWIQSNPPTSGSGSWIQVNPPTGWTSIGDGESAILQNGNYMIANCCTQQQAILDLANLTWLPTGANFRPPSNSEAGWTLLPDGSVLTVDMSTRFNAVSTAYRYLSGTWYCAGTTASQIIDSPDYEMGPWVLLQNGTVFAIGGNGNTGIYTPPAPGTTPPAGGPCPTIAGNTGAWTAGPTFPSICISSIPPAAPVSGQPCWAVDAPAALLTNGNVLSAAGPGPTPPATSCPGSGCYNAESTFFEYAPGSPGTLNATANPPNAPNHPSYTTRLVMLPTGQVLQTDNSNDVEVYTPNGLNLPPSNNQSFNAAYQPTITSPYPLSITRGLTYTISGTLFNGMSQASAYGDDVTNGTNYPLIRVTNQGTGHIFYGHTHDHSSMGVAKTGTTVSTKFEIPAGAETGASNLQIVTNGIPSQNVVVTIH